MDPIQYLGPKKITVVEDTPAYDTGTTSIPRVKVTLEDGTIEVLAKQMFDVMVSEEPMDLTSLRDHRIQPVAKLMLETMLEWGIDVSEVNFITTTLAMSINQSIAAANSKLWGTPENSLNLIQIDEVLKRKVTVADIVKAQDIPPEEKPA